MLRYMTAGETHGKCLTAIVEGMPSGIETDIQRINYALAKRQQGFGRGGRMKIESDTAEILSGVRNGLTLGSPIAIKIENKDWASWEKIMSAEAIEAGREVTCPRPGHADLTGGMKYNHRDLRNVLERASARETAARVAVGALAAELCTRFGISARSRVVSIGGVSDKSTEFDEAFYARAEKSAVGFGDAESEREAIELIERARAEGESLGGVVETTIFGVPAGLGSYAHYDRRLDAAIAAAVMSIQAIKGVEIGMGFGAAARPGSQVHDEIILDGGSYCRKTNNAGGIEGGMSNGEPIVVRAAMKPIPTLYTPLETVDISTKEVRRASVERSDVCAVYAASVVVENAVMFETARAFLEKFGGDCAADIEKNLEAYRKRIEKF